MCVVHNGKWRFWFDPPRWVHPCAGLPVHWGAFRHPTRFPRWYSTRVLRLVTCRLCRAWLGSWQTDET